LTITVLPGIAIAVCVILYANTCARLLHPPDVGSEGKEVVDLEQESKQAVGLVIQRDQFPDWLFAPAKSDDLMEDGANPVYDKEMRSEIFSQGTLMLRLVIQVSMGLCLPLMAVCLYIMPQLAPWYIGYVIMFNMLVGPVFSSGAVTSERERETLDLLLTTIITPWQILWGKLFAGFRVSCVLTLFLLWPLLLACVMVSAYWPNLLSVGAYLAIVLLTCLTTAITALFCSVLFKKSSQAMMTTYLVIILLFCGPLAATFFAQSFFPEHPATPIVKQVGMVSPFATAFSIPLEIDTDDQSLDQMGRPRVPQRDWSLFGGFVLVNSLQNGALLVTMIWLFNTRWRVAD
jgi:ABC-type transport system involved in multi-copper enzyme maturation permease subunit